MLLLPPPLLCHLFMDCETPGLLAPARPRAHSRPSPTYHIARALAGPVRVTCQCQLVQQVPSEVLLRPIGLHLAPGSSQQPALCQRTCRHPQSAAGGGSTCRIRVAGPAVATRAQARLSANGPRAWSNVPSQYRSFFTEHCNLFEHIETPVFPRRIFSHIQCVQN
jgi:hypothetical protein